MFKLPVKEFIVKASKSGTYISLKRLAFRSSVEQTCKSVSEQSSYTEHDSTVFSSQDKPRKSIAEVRTVDKTHTQQIWSLESLHQDLYRNWIEEGGIRVTRSFEVV